MLTCTVYEEMRLTKIVCSAFINVDVLYMMPNLRVSGIFEKHKISMYGDTTRFILMHTLTRYEEL